MTQLLARLPSAVRLSLVQNASTLATTAGSKSAIAPITAEWGDTPSPDRVATMERFEHYVSMTVHGRRIGPIQLRGPHLNDVFAAQTRPKDVPALERAAQANSGALPLNQLTDRAAEQLGRVAAFLAEHSPAGGAAVDGHTPRRGVPKTVPKPWRGRVGFGTGFRDDGRTACDSTDVSFRRQVHG
ncbi:hypothetical protein ABIE67_000155 [Streptomyces sp. V4I8]